MHSAGGTARRLTARASPAAGGWRLVGGGRRIARRRGLTGATAESRKPNVSRLHVRRAFGQAHREQRGEGGKAGQREQRRLQADGVAGQAHQRRGQAADPHATPSNSDDTVPVATGAIACA